MEATTRRNKFSYNMNLTRDYCPDWGKFEVLREFYANAVDADSDHFMVSFEGPDLAVIETTTNPTVEQMFVLGEGTKRSNGDTIGQFGEGIKIASLAATRTRGLHVEITCPIGKITFEFKKAQGMTVATLHANVVPKDRTENTVVMVYAKGIEGVYTENFLTHGTALGRIEKKDRAKGMRIYVRGILIKRCEERSLYDWNLRQVKLNRDRSVPDAWDLRSKIRDEVTKLLVAGDEALAKQLLSASETYESKATEYIYSEEAKDTMTSVFRQQYGDDAVLASSDTSVNTLAKYKGRNPIVLSRELMGVLKVDHSHDVITKSDRLEPSATPIPSFITDEARRLADTLGIPFELVVFNDDGKTDGAAQVNEGRVIIWLNETLMLSGRRFERLRTLLHEMGHIKGGDDASIEFEFNLDWIAAKLADKLLG